MASELRHGGKRHLLLWRKAMINLNSILKSRDITLPTKVLLVKAVVFPVVMYGCESWTILRDPWTARRSNQSILKEMSPECSLERLMLKLKFQYFGYLIWRADTFEKTPFCKGLKAGEGDDRRRDGWMASVTQWTWVWVDSGSWGWTGRPGMLQSMRLQRVGHDWATEMNWTENLFSTWSVSCGWRWL